MATEPSISLVRELLAQQFPDHAALPIRKVEPGGWDNHTFRVGSELLAKLPRSEAYASQPDREHRFLRTLGPIGELETPEPVALGAPSGLFPHHWSLLRWIEGETVACAARPCADLGEGLAAFLRELHRPSPPAISAPSSANFWRGGPLSAIEPEMHRAIESLPAGFDPKRIKAIWSEARERPAPRIKLKVHGDIAPSNLLQRDGRLCAVIDFGLCAAGDPACDLAIAWLAFDEATRRAFLRAYGQDDRALIARGRAWALWKAVLVLAGHSQQPKGNLDPDATLDAILSEHAEE